MNPGTAAALEEVFFVTLGAQSDLSLGLGPSGFVVEDEMYFFLTVTLWKKQLEN